MEASVMADQHSTSEITRLLRELRESDALRHQTAAASAPAPALALLRGWQSQRLAGTYADLLAAPSSAPALRFFLSDLYAPRDFSQRDHDIERLYAFLAQALPASTIQLLTDVVALNLMSNMLDDRLCGVLVDQLGVTDSITPEQYAEGYRICDNYAVRAEQIDRLCMVLTEVSAGSRMPIVQLALMLARFPAQRAGWGELYDFVQRGYVAFRALRDSAAFIATIGQRERRILTQIYASDPAWQMVDPPAGAARGGSAC
jgi:hypothetical protein